MIFHIDLDAFFANVEIRDNPDLKDEVVLICRDSNKSIITTCNYNARKYNIHSGMPLFLAKKLYANPITISPRMDHYKKVSDEVMKIFHSLTDKVIQLSIDEAFLDFTSFTYLYKSAKELALLIQKRLMDEVGLSCSIGISSNYYISKMASSYRKPSGITIIKDEDHIKFIDKIGLKKLWGFGSKSQEIFKQKAIYDTKSAREIDKETLIRKLGNNLGSFLYKALRGEDFIDFTRQIKNKSCSKEITLLEDFKDEDKILDILLSLCEQVYFESLSHNYFAKVITIRIKYSNFITVSKQKSIDSLSSLDEFYQHAKNLFLEKWDKSPIRLIGAGFSNIKTKEDEQANLFENKKDNKLLDKSILELKKKGIKIKKASAFKYKV